MAYLKLRAITIDHTKVSGNQTNYPVLLNGTYSYLKTVSNGGDLQNASGFDLIFVSDSNDQTSLLNWEVERYIATTGEIVIWVMVPAVSSTVDTLFYMWYDNSAITTFQGNVNDTWASSYKGVWHLSGTAGGVAPPDCTDSTSNSNDGTPDGFANQLSVAGQIDGASSFSGGGAGIVIPASASLRIQEFTLSAWVHPTTIGAFGASIQFFAESDNSGTTSGWMIGVNGATNLIKFQYYDGSSRIYTSSFTLANGTLYSLTFVWSRAAGQLLIYNDGALVDTVTTGTTAITYSSDNFFIGGQSPGTGYGGFGDKIDEVRFYSGSQTAGYTLTKYNNEFSPSTFYTISAVDSPFTANCGSPPDGIQGVAYTHTFPTPVTGGIPPFFFALLTRDHETYTPEDVLNNITLDGDTGIWSGYPAAPGVYQFTLDVFDAISREEFVDCEITIADGANPPPDSPGGDPPGDNPPDWAPEPPVGTTPPGPNNGWDFSADCAREGAVGLRHRADGTAATGNAKTTNLTPLTVEAGWTLYTYLYLKGSGGADGSVGFGFMFYDSDGVFLSEDYITSTGSPTVFTQFKGTITVPTDAVTAIPVVQVIGHLTGTWCIDDVYSIRSGGQFVVSSIKHYFDDYTSYR